MLGNTLVDMYAKCGVFVQAHRVLEELCIRNVVTWSALIAGYVQHGQGAEALKCYYNMLSEGHSPDAVVLVCTLKACGSIGVAAKGEEVHAKIANLGMLEKNIVLGGSLVDMYVKCSVLAKAKWVLEELPVRGVVMWSAVIAGYVQQDQGEEALTCFDSMLHEGHYPDAVAFGCALKACGVIGAAAKGEEIHVKIVNLGMVENNVVLGSTLVDIYVKYGAVTKAQEVLEELPIRNAVTWGALIAGYVQQGRGEEALQCYDNMVYEGHSPNAVTIMYALKACGSTGVAAKVEEIHKKIVSLGMMKKHILLGNTLMDMYAKCGALTKAQQMFQEVVVPDVVTWSALIHGYVQQGQGEEALKCYDCMLHKRTSPNAVTFTCALKACGNIGAASKGKEIHEKIVSLGMLEKDIVLGSSLVGMYARCGIIAKAEQVIDELPVRDAVTWSILVVAYVQQGQAEKALKCLDSMLSEVHSGNALTFTCGLKACGSIGALTKGKEIHDKILSLGMLEKDIVLGNALVDMYAKCGVFDKAKEVLQELPVRGVVTWNTLIARYAQQDKGEEALECFDRMLHEGHCPDVVTFTCALKACGSIGATVKGEEIHHKIVSLGLVGRDDILSSSLVEMYAKCGVLAKAQQVLEKLPIRDAVTWGSLIAECVHQGQGEAALKFYESMLQKGYAPNALTFACALRACGSIGVAAKGKDIHGKIASLGLLDENVVLGNALVDMYVKCGELAKAQEVLEELPIHDVVTWSALIGGYAQQGNCLEAINCFEILQSKGMKPDLMTFISMLSACSQSGLLHQAEAYFSKISTKYGINPVLEHYCCMIDLFARAGMFRAALSVIEKMPSDNYLPMWTALLGACRKWGEVNIGRLAFERAFFLDKSHIASYVLMANIYAAAGRQGC